MIKKLLTMVAAFTMAAPFTEIHAGNPGNCLPSKNDRKRPTVTANSLTEDAHRLALARRSGRFTADAVIRARYAIDRGETRALYSDSKHISSGNPILNRGSGQRARFRSFGRPSTTVDRATTSTQLPSARVSVRYTADAAIRAKYANDADYTVALYTTPERESSGGDKSNRGSGHRAYLKSLKGVSATAHPVARCMPSPTITRESVRYTADAAIRAKYANDADYTVAPYTNPERDSSVGKNFNRGSGHRAYLKSFERALSAATPSARNTHSLAVAADEDDWPIRNK